MVLRIQDIGLDQELKDFLPPLTKDELAELEASIERDGFTDPIIVWQNHAVVVDGHNRYRIWREKYQGNEDREPDIIERRFSDRAAVMLWMAARQLGRRNLTAAQRTAIALRMKPVLQEKAKEREQAGKGDDGSGGRGKRSNPAQNSAQGYATTQQGKHKSASARNPEVNQQIADAANVSRDTVRKVETVLAEGSKEIQDAMLAGEKSVNQAYKEATGKPSGGTKFDPTEFDPKLNKELAPTEVDRSKPITERLKEQNRIIESFARGLVKHFDDELPSDPWLDESRATIARDQVKSAAATIRQAKAHDQPCPKCDGKGGKCKTCRGCGYLPKNSYDMAGGK